MTPSEFAVRMHISLHVHTSESMRVCMYVCACVYTISGDFPLLNPFTLSRRLLVLIVQGEDGAPGSPGPRGERGPKVSIVAIYLEIYHNIYNFLLKQ